MSEWFNALKDQPIHTTATALGLDTTRSAFGPCPACQEERRGRQDRRLPCGILRDGKHWICNRCQQQGRSPELVALALTGSLPARGDAEAWKAVRAWYEGPTLQHTPGSPPPPPAWPPQNEVVALWKSLQPLPPSTTATAWARSRNLNPGDISALELARVVPANLTNPLWPGAPWEIALPLYNALGALCSIRWRATQDARPKGRAPTGYSVAELILADPVARAEILAQQPGSAGIGWNKRLIVCEGEPDYLTWASAPHRAHAQQTYAVLGIASGSWSDALAARIPDGTTIFLRTHPDPAGEQYAKRIERSLKGRNVTLCTRSEWTSHTDDNALHQKNQLFIDHIPDPAIHLALPPAPRILPWLTGTEVLPHQEPPPPSWFLYMPAEDITLRRKGILPFGKVGIIGAKGGTGKTSLLCWLAISVATGRPWVGDWRVTPGRVVLVLGEEDAGDVVRKLYFQARALGLSPEEEDQVRARVVGMGGAGRDLSLVRVDPRSGEVTSTSFAEQLFGDLKALSERTGEGYAAILLDPLARFGGVDCEEDAGAATRLIETLERFRTLPGVQPQTGPVVLVAHHTRKPKAGDINPGDDDDLRGSSALRDGARWVLSLTAGPERVVRAKVTKSNVGWRPDPVYLTQPENHHGALRNATQTELTQAQEQLAKKLTGKSGSPSPGGKARIAPGGGVQDA